MLHLLLVAALAPLTVSAEPALVAGTQLQYRGSLGPQGEPSAGGVKHFDVTFWILSTNEAGAELAWLVNEQGQGELPWPSRFDRTHADAQWRSASRPSLLYDRGEGRSMVAVPWPLLVADTPLSVDASFADGKLEYRVDRETKVAGKQAWQISVRDAFGPRRVVYLEQDGPLVLSVTEKLTLGRGDVYQLKLELVGRDRLAGAHFEALVGAIEKLTALQGKLKVPAGAQEVDWNHDQLAVLGEQLPPLVDAAVATPLAKLVEWAQRDFEQQAGRSRAIEDIVRKFVGQGVADFSIPQLAGPAVSQQDLQGNVSVLHFWDYRDEPLKEPYGQVGYLDFLNHRRQASGVRVFGVAVDARLADDKTRAAAQRSVRKLKEFMNLSYPLLLDAGGLLKQFGDPRVVGARLPLVVVVGPDLTIRHYHVGTYPVHQDQGLKALDEAVSRALSAR
jgi:peroxiredoxin